MINWLLFVFYCGFMCTNVGQTLEYAISRTWDGDEVSHSPVKLCLKGLINDSVQMNIEAPFFNDAPVPPGKPGQPVWKLWDYEVVEAFFRGDDENYLEVEVSPYGCHIVLLLKGRGNAVNFCLPLNVNTKIDEEAKNWKGTVIIPSSYFPTNVTKFNAYAIHGVNSTRTYLSLYPVPKEKYEHPNFHRLEYFRDINFQTVLPSNGVSPLSDLWSIKLDPEKGCN